MIVLGLDPGFATIGYGIIQKKTTIKLINCGVIKTSPKDPFENRLSTIHSDLTHLIKNNEIHEVAIEKLFFSTNVKTGIDVAQARGVLLLTCTQENLPIAHYTPLQIKQQICGYGQATKKQIQWMITNQLQLQSTPKPDDAADAVAVAMCHANAIKYNQIITQYSQ